MDCQAKRRFDESKPPGIGHHLQRQIRPLGSPEPIDHAVVTQRNKALVHILKSLIFDTLYPDDLAAPMQRSYARFYALETIARQPYFAYLSVLHLMETLGKWRRVDLMTVHFAESHNELHHLLICESLGGHEHFGDRWLAQHVAWFYYWMVCILYLTHPATAYNLNQCIEEEAYHTYDTFLQRHGDYLKTQPAPAVAVQYYTTDDSNNSSSNSSNGGGTGGSTGGCGDGGLFRIMHTGAGSSELEAPASARRRPLPITSLYDTFRHMRDDEGEHAHTMELLQHVTRAPPAAVP